MQSTLFDNEMGEIRPSPSRRTSPVSCSPKTTPSAVLLGHWLGRTVHCDRQGKGGRTLVVCMDRAEPSHGGFWTLNTSECPNDVAGSSLWQVLEPSAPSKYYLSKAACAGILRRAQIRGRQLPERLQAALTDGGPGNQPEAAAAGLFQPVIHGKSEVVGVYGEGSFADYREGRISTVKASGGACGYGSENLIASINGNIIGRTPQNGGNGSGFNHDIAPTLTRTDRHAVAFQSNNSASMNMPVCDGMAPTLTCNAKYMSVQYSTQVRRFTPVECERLQGFPDNYTQVVVKGKEAKDTPRYVAIGNSMPVPVMHWLGKRIRGAYLMQRFQLLGESQPTPYPNI